MHTSKPIRSLTYNMSWGREEMERVRGTRKLEREKEKISERSEMEEKCIDIDDYGVE